MQPTETDNDMRFFLPTRFLFSTLALTLALAASTAEAAVAGTVTGQVLDAAAAPVADLEIQATRASQPALTTRSDSEGWFVFAGLEPGSYLVTVLATMSSGRTGKTVEVVDGATVEVELRLSWLLQDSVTVSGTVTRELNNVPGAVALVTSEQLDATRRHNMRDVLALVPGVLAQSRWGADETQLSVRGSGLRNNFHHRGLNLLINGVAYQDADGFGDFETLDLMATERVEVWKGANALRFGGNTLGGAVNFVTYSGATGGPLTAALTGGSYGLAKGQVSVAGESGPTTYYLSGSHTEQEGFRRHAEQERSRLFGNVRWKLGEAAEFWADTIYADVYEKLPGALTREEFEGDPRQASPGNLFLDSGRFYDYGRMGFGYRRRFDGERGETSLEATVFGQVRDVLHPIFQVLDQDQRTYGSEIRYTFEAVGTDEGPRRPLRRFVLGVAPQWGDNDERRFANLGGARGPLVGEFGAEADNLGTYFELELAAGPRLTWIAGARWDRAERRYEDRFLADGDRSDEISFEALSPKIGFLWRSRPEFELFANVSRAYEPPLILELTSFGAPGFLDLAAQDSWQLELGARGASRGGMLWEASIYDAEIEDEIVNENVRPFPFAPFTIPSYRNVAATRHRGVELGLSAPLAQSVLRGGDRLSGQLAYTFSEFRFVDDLVHAGNELPGAPRHLARGELRYEVGSGWFALSADWSPEDYYLDSANTVANDPYVALGLRAGYEWRTLGFFAELGNLTDERYSGSVQVDSADGRFFEPAEGRSVAIGVRYTR